MAEFGNFEKLVSRLSLEERQNLLEKLNGQAIMSGEPLYNDDEEAVSGADIETEFAKLPWYYHLWYNILSFFKSKPPVAIFGDYQVSLLGKKINEKTPGLYNYQKRLLLPAFFRHIERLKEASRFFYGALDTSVNRDRGAFFSFLGSLEMPDVHIRLQTDTDPKTIFENNPGKTENELRQIALRAVDDALGLITDESRNAMYFNARVLNRLKELSSFLFDRVLLAFGYDTAEKGETCSVSVVRELLESLSNILISLKVVPPMTLLESLFVFALQERSGENGFDINRESRSLLLKAEEAVSVIREFNKHVPLTWIVRCSSRNMSFIPREIGGGEEWLLIFRDYWKRKVDFLFSEYFKNRKQGELLEAFRRFLNGKSLKTMENAQTDTNAAGMPVKGAFALSFLLSFYSEIFMNELNKFLRPILIDGDFHKKENRIEFAESYNDLIKLEDMIKKLDREISPEGDFGKRYAHARQDMSSLPVKRRKIQIVTDEASEDAAKIINQTRDASRNMINILNGILGRESRVKYDTLNNLSQFTGKDGQFYAGLDNAVKQFDTVVRLLDNIEVMENGY